MMTKVSRDYAFLQDEKAAIAMQTEPGSKGIRITLSVAFCRQASSDNEEKPTDSFCKDTAKSVLDTRLSSEKSEKYTCEIVYLGDKPKREIMMPFVQFVRQALTAGSGKRRNVNRVFANLSNWRAWQEQRKRGLGLADAQQQSMCGIAIRRGTNIGDVIWPTGSPVAYSGIGDYAPMPESASQKQEKFQDWIPKTPRKVEKEPKPGKATRRNAQEAIQTELFDAPSQIPAKATEGRGYTLDKLED